MKKILIILSLFFLSSSYTEHCSPISADSEKECQINRKVSNDENDCCFVNFIYKFYGHEVPISICQEVPKNKELKDFAKEEEEYQKKNHGSVVIYKKVLCEKRSFTIE